MRRRRVSSSGEARIEREEVIRDQLASDTWKSSVDGGLRAGQLTRRDA